MVRIATRTLLALLVLPATQWHPLVNGPNTFLSENKAILEPILLVKNQE